MSGCHEPKCICNINLSSINHLIEHCQSGIEKCFEKIEHLEKVVSSLANLIANKVNTSFERSINDTLKKHEIKIEKVENNTVAKSILEHDFRKIIDRINELEKLYDSHESYLKNIHTYEFADIKKVDHNFEEMKEKIENTAKSILETRIQFINQLHGNEEIDCRFKELSNRISYFEKMINSLYFSSEKPNKCPVCEGKGNIK